MFQTIESEKLIIRRFELEDIEKVADLFQDLPALYYYLPSGVKSYSLEELPDFLADWNDGEENFLFLVTDKNEQAMGLVNLENFSLSMGHTEFGIGLLAEARGQGFGAELCRLLLDYLFIELGLNRVYARYIEGNLASAHLLTKLGFREEGAWRKHVKREEGYLDMRFAGLLAEEYRALVKESHDS